MRTLVDCRLLRREPRNESIFYEITHDRLTEAIARNRRVILPRWFWPGVAASIVFVILASFTALWMYEAREEAKRALNVLLGEPLVGRLREVGLSDALERVLDDANIDSSSNSLASALSLRHEGDILWEHATIKEAREKFNESLAALDGLQAGSDGGDPGLAAERARILKRLGQVSEDGGHVSEAARHYRESVDVWEQLLKRRTVAEESLDAAESWVSLGAVHDRMGDAQAAEHAFTTALQLALNVLTAGQGQVQPGHREIFFEQGRAMQSYADSALNLAGVWAENRNPAPPWRWRANPCACAHCPRPRASASVSRPPTTARPHWGHPLLVSPPPCSSSRRVSSTSWCNGTLTIDGCNGNGPPYSF